jgi:hypothetical protein
MDGMVVSLLQAFFPDDSRSVREMQNVKPDMTKKPIEISRVIRVYCLVECARRYRRHSSFIH